MSKILKNQTGSPISIADVGVSLPASPATYTIPAQDYLLWAASSDIVTQVGNGNVIVNDGSVDLSISDGIDLVKGIFPSSVGLTGPSGTPIGNEGANLNIINQTPGARNIIDANNSTTTPLGISGTFIGTGTDVSAFNSVVIMLFSNQGSTINGMKFQFSTDNVNWDDSLDYTLVAGSTRRFTVAVQAKYFRLNYTNGAIAQSTFRVQIILHDSFPGAPTLKISDAITDNRSATLVKSVITGLNRDNQFVNIRADIQSALKTSSVLTDKGGNDVAVSTFSELRVVNRQIDLQAKFIYGVSSILFNKISTNGGTLTEADSQAQLRTGTNAAGKYEIRSKKNVNYRVSETNEFSATCRFPFATGTPGSQVGVNNSRALLGLFIDGQDGIYIGFKNNGRFSVFYCTNTVETQIQSTSFNIDKLDGVTVTDTVTSQYAPDWTKIQLIRIVYSWHGAASISYQIQSPNEEWITFHRQVFINQVTTPSIGTPLLPINALIENTGNTTSIELDLQAAQCSQIGNASVTSQAKGFAADTSKTVSTQVPILSIRNNTTFNGKNNGIRVILQTVGIASEGNKSVIVRAYVDSVLTAASFVAVSATESVVSVDTSATVFSGGIKVIAVPLAKVDTYNDDISALELEIQPGQTVTFTGQSTSTNEVTIGIRWRELH
jgi:hypothetical protein